MDKSKPFTDSRGTITDLIVTPQYSITHVTFKKGAVRGNHYHKQTIQEDVVLKGKLICNQDGFKFEIETGEFVYHMKGQKHAYKALENSEMISICFGKRRGTDYEKDTFRLSGNEKLF